MKEKSANLLAALSAYCLTELARRKFLPHGRSYPRLLRQHPRDHPAPMIARCLPLAIALLLLGCLDTPAPSPEDFVRREVVRGRAPVRSAEIENYPAGDEIYITFDDSGYKQAVDMSVFGQAMPKMTFDQAKAKLGSPDPIEESRKGTSYKYRSNRDTIVVSHEKESSAGDAWMWRLLFIPDDRSPASLLPAPILEHMNPKAPYTSFVLLNKDGTPGVQVKVKSNHVEYVQWIRTDTR